MNHCPKCSSHFDGSRCPDCGHKILQPVQLRRTVVSFQNTSISVLSCADERDGRQCSKAGSLASHPAGPYYCAQHFPPFAGRGKGTAPPQGFQALRQLIPHAQLPKRQLDDEAEAERRALQAGL